MGVPYYFTHIIKRYPNIIKKKMNCDNFYLDSNSIIYDAIDKVKNVDNFEIDLIEEVCKKIHFYISELKPNKKYFLKYSEKSGNEEKGISMYKRDKEESEKVYWETIDKKSIKRLNSNLKLEFEKTEVIHYGCGPEANAIFKIMNRPESEIWYKTEVVEIGTGNKSVYYIKEWNGKLNVGHSMCSGAFTFKKDGKYKVRFTPMNIDGKKLDTTEWSTFESPFMNNKSPFGN